MSPKCQKYKQIHARAPTRRNLSGFELNPYLNGIFIFLPALLLAFQCHNMPLKAINLAKFNCSVEQCPLQKRDRYNSGFHLFTGYIAPVLINKRQHLYFRA